MVTVCALLMGADDGPQQILWHDLKTGQAVIVGELGVPLGTYVTVEGIYRENKFDASAHYVEIDKLDGKALDPKIVMGQLKTGKTYEDHVQELSSLKDAHRYELRGYEMANIHGWIFDPKIAANKSDKRDAFAKLRFDTQLRVTEIKDLGLVEKSANNKKD